VSTLVYRSGVLASDTRGSTGRCIAPDHIQKIFELDDGRLAGFVGYISIGASFIRALAKGSADLPELGEDTQVVVVLPGGRVRVYESGGWYEHRGRFGAWGSGEPAALGALHVGATAEQAVAAAMKVDVSSGGKVRAVRLKRQTKGGKVRAVRLKRQTKGGKVRAVRLKRQTK
jgi:hypothetical protein